MALSVIAVSISVSPLRIDERRDRHVHDVGAEPLAGDLERGLGAGRGLEEQVDLGAAAQGGALLVDLAVELDEFLGEVEQAGDVVGGKALDPQQMAVAEDEGRFRWRWSLKREL